MADQEQLAALLRGPKDWKAWRRKNPDTKINLDWADIHGADLSDAYLRGAYLSGANLKETLLCRANLSGADLRIADLGEANLTEADLSGADLRGANLAKAVISGADLSGARLDGANLMDTDLRKADLSHARMNKAYLFNADLKEANLSEANLTRADLRTADLGDADLSEAYLDGTNLGGADLVRTKFTGSAFGSTIFAYNDLSNAIGLENARHWYPSTIGVDTIRRSNGKIPEVFLRGCGLSDLEIEQVKLFTPGLDSEQVTNIVYQIHHLYMGNGIQYYSCFISYNNADDEFAHRLYDDLQNNGVRCWFAPEDMKIGDRIRPVIDQQIKRRDKLLVVLSDNSIISEWVGDEVEAALEEEKVSGRTILFPIRLDDAVMQTREDWAAKIKRRRHIGDFSEWRDEAKFKVTFDRLLNDLRAGT